MIKQSSLWSIFLAALLGASIGCQTLRPDPIPTGAYHVHPDLAALDDTPIEQGKPNKVVDAVGWTVGIPSKLLLWNRKVDNHKISGQTIQATAEYMDVAELGHVKVRANQYAPQRDWKRLRANKTMHWLPRYTLGTISLGYEAFVPGRIFGGDHYNPFTQTVHLYSDIPAISWHELAHAKDFSRRESQATYSLAYAAIPLWHETIASQDVMSYVADRGDREEIAQAVEILYPAYGTYAGGLAGQFASSTIAMPVYYGTVMASHINARLMARRIRGGSDMGVLTSVAMNQAKTQSLDGIGISEIPGMIDEQEIANVTKPVASDSPFQTASFACENDRSFQTLSIPDRGTTFRDDDEVVSLPSHVGFGMRGSDYSPDLHFSRRGESGKVTLGDAWSYGLDARLSLRSLGQPGIVASFIGYTSEDTASDPTLPNHPQNEYAYETQQYEFRLGKTIDANLMEDRIGDMSDQIETGFGYTRFFDQYQSPFVVVEYPGSSRTVNYVGDWQASNTNHILHAYLDFQRHFRIGKWRWSGSVGAYGGPNFVSREQSRTVTPDASFYFINPPQSESIEKPTLVTWVTGQELRFQTQYSINDTMELTGGFRANRVTNLSGALEDSFRNDDFTFSIVTADLYAGASMRF